MHFIAEHSVSKLSTQIWASTPAEMLVTICFPFVWLQRFTYASVGSSLPKTVFRKLPKTVQLRQEPSLAMAYLNAETGSAFGRRYELDKPESIMGRHPECDVILEVGAVSRQHAKIVRQGEAHMLEDLKSRNGTFLNGKLISEPTELVDGDMIRICDLEFSFHADDSSALDGGRLAEGSSLGILMVDDPEESSQRAITGKLDLSSMGTQFMVSPEVKLTALIEIMKNLGRAVALDDVLPKVLDSLFKVFIQADRGFLLLKDAEGQLQPRWVKTRREDQQESVRISRTVLRQIMEHKQAMISLDASSDERFEMSQSVADFKIRSMIVAPLLNSYGDPIGAIQLDTLNQRNRFEEKDLEVLVAIANQAGIAIENAQLHEQVLTQKLLQQDLLYAKQVQEAFLPKVKPNNPAYSFYQFYHAANQIGGDYFDYIQLGPDRLAVVVADVVGHGVAAAMFMAKLSAETRFAFANQSDPALALALLNTRIMLLGLEKMVTMLVIILDNNSRQATIVNAGHMPPILHRADGTLHEPSAQESGLPLGVDCETVYEVASVQLASGDTMTLYTDGIFEAPNAEGEQFSINRIRQLVQNAAGKVEQTGKSIVEAVRKHVGECSQEDDMCLVVVGKS